MPPHPADTKSQAAEYRPRRFERHLRHLVGRAIGENKMIFDGDTIAIGVSGGKDSLVLARFLADLRRRAPIKFTLGAIHLGADESGAMARWLGGLKLDFMHIEPAPVIKEIENYQPGGPSPCFICAQARRARLFTLCREFRAGRLALGHHMDDAIETLLMNIFFSGRIDGIKARQDIFNGELSIIRPLFLAPEKLIIEAAANWALPVAPKNCPADGLTSRQTAKNLVAEMVAKQPKVYGNLMSAAISAQKLH
ncbi:hypothetical protein LJB99_05380 [Deltaproteobacteria bacterium OttesenSCG-928-K17]|nr:hypothetical protein [Deltaproteobacteria bacterium OttesenSCG-928-K17]